MSIRLIVLLLSIGSVCAFGWGLGAFWSIVFFKSHQAVSATTGTLAGLLLAWGALRANRTYMAEIDEEIRRREPMEKTEESSRK
jgi:hypothetical protein